MLPGLGRRSAFERTRQEGKSFGAIAEPRHRVPAKFIAGVDQAELGDDAVETYAAPNRGAFLAYPVVAKGHPNVKRNALDPADVFMAFELWAPVSSCAPGEKLVYFRVLNHAHRDQAIIDSSSQPCQSADLSLAITREWDESRDPVLDAVSAHASDLYVALEDFRDDALDKIRIRELTLFQDLRAAIDAARPASSLGLQQTWVFSWWETSTHATTSVNCWNSRRYTQEWHLQR